MRIVVCLLFIGVECALGQPVVQSVLNAASYAVPEMPNSGIAQGSMFVIFGDGLGPVDLQTANAFPLPNQLAGTSVRVTVAGAAVDAIMIYSSRLQVAAVLPSRTATGAGTLTISYNGASSAGFPVKIVPSAFGIFTLNQAGSGPGVVTTTAFQTSTLLAPAKPADTMIIWGTGLGPVAGDEAAKPLPGDLGGDVQVLVGNQPANVIYKGRSGCCTGIDQIVFSVPAGLEGCYVPVAVKAGGAMSNFATLSISSSAGTCSDPNAFSGADLRRLQSQPTANYGLIVLGRTKLMLNAPPPLGASSTTTDSGFGSFDRFDLKRLILSQGILSTPSPGYCSVFQTNGSNSGARGPGLPDHIDAGPALNITGPKGRQQLTRQSDGSYSAQLGNASALYLDPGSYTVDNASGGRDVGSLRATLNVPAPITWTNQDSTSAIPLSRELTVTWSGGDPAREYVTITGIAATPNPRVSATFVCTERASAGRFTVPVSVLAALPANGLAPSSSTLSVASAPFFDGSSFTAPGIDAGYFTYSAEIAKTVVYQ